MRFFLNENYLWRFEKGWYAKKLDPLIVLKHGLLTKNRGLDPRQ